MEQHLRTLEKRTQALQGDEAMAQRSRQYARLCERRSGPHGFDEIVKDDFASLCQMLSRRR
jgi:hypothetical protein